MVHPAHPDTLFGSSLVGRSKYLVSTGMVMRLQVSVLLSQTKKSQLSDLSEKKAEKWEGQEKTVSCSVFRLGEY